MSKKTKIIIGIIVIGLIFFGGYEYGLSRNNSATTQTTSGAGGLARRSFSGGGGGGMVAGQIIAKDATSLTLSLRAGGSQIILVSTSTEVQQMTKGTLDDLATGTSVSVNGPTNADGSVTAQSVQIRPNLPQGQGQNAGQSSPAGQ